MRIGKNEAREKYGIDLPRGLYSIKIEKNTYHVFSVRDDTLGCPLLGAEQTETGVRDCAAVNSTLKRRIQLALDRNERVWLEVS